MITTDKLIQELYKFPSGARLIAQHDQLLVTPKTTRYGNINYGVISVPARGPAKKTALGHFKDWQKGVLDTDDGGRILLWLREHPKEAVEIAFAAISGLYLDHRDEYALPEDHSYPRGSGSDYVDHVGSALEAAGIMPLIRTLQEAAEDDACTQCGESTADGEGYDGLCGNCADKAEREEDDDG